MSDDVTTRAKRRLLMMTYSSSSHENPLKNLLGIMAIEDEECIDKFRELGQRVLWTSARTRAEPNPAMRASSKLVNDQKERRLGRSFTLRSTP